MAVKKLIKEDQWQQAKALWLFCHRSALLRTEEMAEVVPWPM